MTGTMASLSAIARGTNIDRIAGLEAARSRADRLHDTAGIEADRPGQRVVRYPLQGAVHQFEIDRIKVGCMNFNDDSVGFRDWIRKFGKPYIVRYRTIASQNECAHGSSCGG
jgi:hypothetical protein